MMESLSSLTSISLHSVQEADRLVAKLWPNNSLLQSGIPGQLVLNLCTVVTAFAVPTVQPIQTHPVQFFFTDMHE